MATAATAIARHHKAVAVQPPSSRPCAVASRCAWWQPHITALPCSLFLLVQPVGKACCPAQALQSCRLVCLPVVVIARCGNTLRFYITPHCIKCMASQSPSSFGGHAPLSRPIGFTQQALCKVAYAGSGRQLSALPGRYAPYAPPPVALWVWLNGGFGQALCAVLFSQRLRRVIGCWPPPTLGARLLRKHRLRGLPVRPPRGLPQNRALHQLRTHFTLGASEFPAGMSIGVTAEAQC